LDEERDRELQELVVVGVDRSAVSEQHQALDLV
jgi:hypothetical protein